MGAKTRLGLSSGSGAATWGFPAPSRLVVRAWRRSRSSPWLRLKGSIYNLQPLLCILCLVWTAPGSNLASQSQFSNHRSGLFPGAPPSRLPLRKAAALLPPGGFAIVNHTFNTCHSVCVALVRVCLSRRVCRIHFRWKHVDFSGTPSALARRGGGADEVMFDGGFASLLRSPLAV